METRLLYAFPEPLPMQKARALQVVHTVDSLARAGVAIDFAYVPLSDATDPFLHYGLSCPKNVRLVPLSRSLPWPFARLRTHSNYLFLWRLRRWLKKRFSAGDGPTVVFVRHIKLAHALIQAYPRLPLIYEAHEIFSRAASHLYSREKAVIEQAAALVAITANLVRAINIHFNLHRPIAIVPSATTLPRERPEKDWSAAARHIIYTGSLYGWKGVDDLIIAAGKLPGCCITVIGGTEKSIARLRKMLNPDGADVVFAGHLSHNEVQNHLHRACIAILPNRSGSVSEYTSPLKLFEYMAAGCALVVSDLPVMREILGEHDCAWFSAGDSDALAHSIHNLAENPGLAQHMAERTWHKAALYSWDARADRLVKVIRSVNSLSQESGNRLL